MANDALADVLKNSSWFEDHVRRLYGEDADPMAFIAYISGRPIGDSTPSLDNANVSAFGTNAPQAPSFDSIARGLAGTFSQPANIGSVAGMAVPGPPGAIGDVVGAAFGDLALGVAPDPKTFGFFNKLGIPALEAIFNAIPADLFSAPELQTPHPDISAQPGQGYQGDPTQPGIPSGVMPGVNAMGELSVGEHPNPATSNEGTSNTSGTGPDASYDRAEGAAGPTGSPDAGHPDAWRGGFVMPRGRHGYASGGNVRGIRLFGPNPPGPDEGAAFLQPGEMVMPKVAVEHFGKKRFFNMIREAHEARGEHARMMKDVTPGRKMFG